MYELVELLSSRQMYEPGAYKTLAGAGRLQQSSAVIALMRYLFTSYHIDQALVYMQRPDSFELL